MTLAVVLAAAYLVVGVRVGRACTAALHAETPNIADDPNEVFFRYSAAMLGATLGLVWPVLLLGIALVRIMSPPPKKGSSH